MDDVDKLVIEHLRGDVARYRRLAEAHDALGELQKAWDCRALADIQEERARKIERRQTAA